MLEVNPGSLAHHYIFFLSYRGDATKRKVRGNTGLESLNPNPFVTSPATGAELWLFSPSPYAQMAV